MTLRVGVLGATGMVGQRLVQLLHGHPYFDAAVVAASGRSEGKEYREAVAGKPVGIMPQETEHLIVRNAADVDDVSRDVDLVFSTLEMDKETLRALEEAYAKRNIPVVSTSSANRWTPDVPVVIPEINPHHLSIIPHQRKRLGTRRGFIVTKPNCSIQSYVPPLHALREFGPSKVSVCTYQAISGAGKTFETWPEMVDNVIPYIGGEEEKSITEPLKVWGTVANSSIVNATKPLISAHCIRVPVSDGHLAAVSVSFERRPSMDEVLDRWMHFKGRPQELNLPSAPVPFLRYFHDDAHPQTRLHRNEGNGMAITIGRLRPDTMFDYQFAALSHNTIRGAAGGALLTAELLKAEGYLDD